MKTFAFIFFPRTTKELRRFLPCRKNIPLFFLKPHIKNTPPFQISHIKKIRSSQGEELQGFLLACPLIPQSADKLDEGAVLERLIFAVGIARKMKADILGLDINLPNIAKDKKTLEAKLKIPLTNGYALTAWSIFETVYRVAKIKNIDLEKSALAIIGEVASVGALCAERLSAYGCRIIREVKNQDSPEFRQAITEADILINLNDNHDFFLKSIKELKPGVVICDISLDTDAITRLRSLRKDIAVIRAGLMRLPFPVQLGIKLGVPKDIIPAAIAETMLIAFEDKVPGDSLSKAINPDKLEELADIAVRHGLEVWVPEAPVL